MISDTKNKSSKLNILILTQKVDKNDDVLGFFHAWIGEFAKHCEKVTVVCLGKGEHDLPENVKVLSLGKEEGAGRAEYIARFYRYLLRERKNYDTVFVHMNTEYVVLGGLLWRIFGKKTALWYTHKSVTLKLRIAEKLADVILTASKESFRLPSKKIRVMGHGIDVSKFKARTPFGNNQDGKLRIITVGRISPVKDCETLIRAAGIFSKKNSAFEVKIFGKAGTSKQEKYLQTLKTLVVHEGLGERVRFMGNVTQDALPGVLQDADVFVNMSHTGGLDKAVLEAMACEIPVITCNETFSPILGKYDLMFTKGGAEELENKILALCSMGEERFRIGRELRKVVEKEHNLTVLIPRVITELTKS
jgi:glycosyltransferase involved in cell wall biosynthesis